MQPARIRMIEEGESNISTGLQPGMGSGEVQLRQMKTHTVNSHTGMKVADRETTLLFHTAAGHNEPHGHTSEHLAQIGQ